MLQLSTIKFLKDLKKNNNKEWFDKNRKSYDVAKADYLSFVGSLLSELKKTDPSLLGIEAKQCVFRINRDVRFSKDKSPYKTNMGAGISKGGKSMHVAGYYFHCEPGQCFLAGGIWMPESSILQKIRQEIDYNAEEFSNIVSNKKFVAQFKGLEKNKEYILSRPPKGYADDNPAIEFLKFKSYIVSTPVTDEDLVNPKLIKQLAQFCNTLKPLIYFLNRAIEG